MNNLSRITKTDYLVFFKNGEWLLNVYLIRSNPNESISDDEVRNLVEKYLAVLEESCMSSEFNYYRIGCVFLHYGNRGIDLTFWHYGSWGSTFEVFSCSWYCYNRDINSMELLDAAEPRLSQYEIVFLNREYNTICKIIKNSKDYDTFKAGFIDEYRPYLDE